MAPKPGEVQAMNHLDKAGQARRSTAPPRRCGWTTSTRVVLPGGVANADQLRLDAPAVDFVQAMVRGGPAGRRICHGAVDPGRSTMSVRGRTLTSWPSLRTDIINAGGTWVDEEVQVCTNGPNTLDHEPQARRPQGVLQGADQPSVRRREASLQTE